MSVIFKTLQKLRQNGQEEQTAYVEPKRKRRGHSPRRIFLPIGLFTFLAITILCLAWWDSRATTSQVEKGSLQTSFTHEKGLAGEDELKPAAGTTDPKDPAAIAEPSFYKPVEAGGSSSMPLKKSGTYLLAPEAKGKDEHSPIRYIAPESKGFSEKDAVTPAKKIGYFLPRKSEKIVPRVRNKVAYSPSKSKPRAPVKLLNVEPFSVPIQQVSKSAPIPDPVKTESERAAIPAVEADTKFSTENLIQDSGREPSGELKKKRTTYHRAPETKPEVSDIDRSAEVSRLVATIQGEMQRGDEGRVYDLLRKLEAIKGPGNDYVTRLRAFWFLKQGNYDRARSLLESLLEKDENDIEAGVNMAILDIKTNRLQMARERLRKMRRLNADNTLIPSIMEKIRD